MKRHFGRTLALVLLGLVALAAVVLRTRWAGEKACAAARTRLPALLGMEVTLGECRLDPLRGGIEIRGLSVTPPRAAEPLFAADRVLARLSFFELLASRVRFERIEAVRPRIRADLTTLELPRGERRGCFLESLKGFEVDALAVEGAEVHLVAAGGRSVDLDAVDVDLRLTRHAYTVRLSVPQGRVGTGNVELPLRRLRLSSVLDLDRQKLTVNHLEIAAGDVALSARGDVETVCEPSLAMEASLFLPLDLVSAALGADAPAMSGTAAVNLKRAEGALADPSLELELTLSRAQVEGIEVGDAFLEARLEKGRLQVDKLDLAVGEGRARVRGSVGLGGGFPVDAVVELEELPFARLLDKLTIDHAWIDFLADGKVEAKGQLVPFKLSGPASIAVRELHVFDRGWDRPDPFHILDLPQAQIDLHADFTPERARLTRARIRTERGSAVDVDATLHFDLEKGLDLVAEPREVELAELAHVIGIPWEGKLSGRAHLRGPYGPPTIDGEVAVRDFRFHQVAVGTAEAQVQLRVDEGVRLGFPQVKVFKGRSRFDLEGVFDLGADVPRVRASGSFDNAWLSDLVAAIGDEHWVFDPLRGHAEARVSGRAQIDSPVLAPRARVEVRLEDFTYLDRRFGSGRLVFRAEDGERVILDPVELEGPCGRLRLAGRVELDEEIAFELDAPALYAQELALPNGEFLGARGELAVRMRFFGPPDHPRGEGTLVVKDLAAFGAPLGGGTLGLEMDRVTLSMKGPVGEDLLVDGRVVFQGELPFAVGVSAETRALGRYFPAIEGLRGALAGELLATGTLVRYPETRGDLWLSRAVVETSDWTLESQGPLALSFQGGLVELKPSVVKGTAGTRLNVAGVLDEGALDVAVDGAFDARLVELVLPWLEQTGGSFQVQATVSGPPSKPEVVGTAELQGGRFSVQGWPVSAREVRGRLEFSQNRLFLNELVGAVNNGQVQLHGEVEMDAFSPSRLDLIAAVDEMQYRWRETVPAAFSGNFRLYGPLSSMVLSGNADLNRLRYSDEIDLESMMSNARRGRLDARSFDKREEYLRYEDLKVHVVGGGGSRVDNNVLKVSFKGDLDVVGTNLHWGLLGTLNAEEGGRGFFRNNEFWINRFTVDFNERDRIAAVVDAHAETQVRDYKVWLHAFGPYEDPQVELRSEPELDRTDVVALLTLGVTSRDQGTYTGTAGAGLVSDALMNIAGLDKQFRKFVPKNTIVRDFNFHISTQYSDVSGMVEPTAQLESKIFTDSFKLRLSQPVISGKGRRAQIEYRFNEHVSAQGQWDNEASDSSLGDLGVDLKLRWELE